MADVFEGVEVGDTIAVSHVCKLESGWGRVNYRKDFVSLHKVTRVLKTQVCANELKYFKHCGNPVKGTKTGQASLPVENAECQFKEVLEYESKLNVIRRKIYSNKFDLTNCKNIDDALKAVELLEQLQELAPARGRG